MILRLTDALDGVSYVLCGPGQWTSKIGSFPPPSPCATKSNKGQKNRRMLLNQEAESKATKDFINYEYICKFHKVV